MNDSSVEIIDIELSVLIRRVTSASRKIGHLDRSAYLLLHRILSQGPAGVKTLADESRLDISTISRQTAALEQKGYVVRNPDLVDKRAYTLEITDLGRKEFHEHQKLRFTAIKEVLKEWPEEERQLFGILLKKYNQASLKKE
ncbi:MarR family winged helix-turn-helix transcriptional regulator [Niallia sp. NCCP-28]|uniref:MarR family winged helix-turn-helix transcriptional regulator n=1 Tax=Niallia sp. NCCP-28 TaxID=2934712 RepID=UPI0020814406|nr:MarR family transcriptional regulator [Niallia sp. NCCP-28]GKU83032.1 putative HTH-type transcriptional regulator YxaD [Niallia sp. NCCP-28]